MDDLEDTLDALPVDMNSEQEQMIKELHETFAEATREELVKTLRECENDKEAAFEELWSVYQPSPMTAAKREVIILPKRRRSKRESEEESTAKKSQASSNASDGPAQPDKVENGAAVVAKAEVSPATNEAAITTNSTKRPAADEDDDDDGWLTTNGQPATKRAPHHPEARVVTAPKPSTAYRLDDSESEEEMVDDDDDDDDQRDENELKGQMKVLDYFNTASKEALAAIPRMPEKKVKPIISKRPFKSYDHLKDVINSTQGVVVTVLDNCRELIEEKEVTDELMVQCSKISGEMQKIFGAAGNLEELRALSKEDLGDAMTIPEQPESLTGGTLKAYQLIGLNWLALLDNHEVNAILADEMGLGKTVQSISFIAHILSSEPESLHLIVVPPSTHDNWIREIEKWCPDISILDYVGAQKERAAIRKQILRNKSAIKEYQVLVTTYTVLTSKDLDRTFMKHFKFRTVTFDEGHMLKNMKSQRYELLSKLRAERRVLLTGTPLQNNLMELMSLLTFVMPSLFKNVEVLRRIFTRKNTSQEEQQYQDSLISRARNIMAPFVLRRLKKDVLSQLPPKRYRVVECDLTDHQRKHYIRIQEQAAAYRAEMDEILARATNTAAADTPEDLKIGDERPTRDPVNNVLMQLRKMANHPLLHRCYYTDEKIKIMSKLILQDENYKKCDSYAVFEDLEVMSDFAINKLCRTVPVLQPYALSDDVVDKSGKLLVLESLLKHKKAAGDRVLVFSQFTTMLDLLEVFLTDRGYNYIRLDGSTPVTERQALIDQYNDDEEVFIFLLSTKAGGLGINLTAANTVILHDIDFNPYNDKQAEDRCHRVGQTQSVEVIRLIAADSVENDMQKKAEFKLQLERDMTGVQDAPNKVIVETSQQLLDRLQ
eukprot:TRINITY_DN11674_c5_g1_i3.p1 TRINITY_DN11674_c5_g1~~TRINITY_DN11674_c5_g1_i3.p1  ORF type:complete len:886 (+),score=279.81 TRINITY_DN11674_c5_g1_i3:78-2735(+)